MQDERHIQELLHELLESGRTLEEVCTSCPELLTEVGARLKRLRAVEAKIDDLFPATPLPLAEVEARRQRQPGLPRIAGYVVDSILGHGGMGVVYRARHTRLNRLVAVKMMLSGAYASVHERERFTREAESVASLRHANIVQVYDVGDVEGRTYFTMELVEGCSLAQQLAGRPQPARDAAALLATLADAVEFAHKSGVVHRDLKPSNILLTCEGTPKIVDFGLARRVDGGAALTRSGSPIGTPSYMAPEQATGKSRVIGPSTDVYALGAILYEMLTGRPPFRAESAVETERQVITEEPVAPSRLNARVPRDLETICLKCLHKEPTRRYSTAAALSADLNRFLRGEPIVARPVGAVERAWKWVRRRPTRAAVVVGGLLFVASALGAVVWTRSQRGVLAAAAREDLAESLARMSESRWTQARAALERAKGRLGSSGPDVLVREADQIDHDLAVVAKLGELRSQRVIVVGQRLNDEAVDRGYRELFASAGLGEHGDDAAAVAAKITASNARGALVVALDDWVLCNTDAEQRDWKLEVARRSDPDPWRDRVRTFARSDNAQSLSELAASPSLASQPISTALLLASRLRAAGVEVVPFLRRVQFAHPDDFWIQFELGCALDKADDPSSIECYQAALAIRPGTPAVLENLGAALASQRRFDEAFNCYEQVLRIEPQSAVAHLNYSAALSMASRFAESEQHARKALSLDPTLSIAHSSLAYALWRQGNHAEANSAATRALELGLPSDGLRANASWIAADCKRRLDLQARLAGIVAGSERPSDPAEAAQFAIMATEVQLYGAAAKLFKDAFAERPDLADDFLSGQRTHAAYAAAMLGRDQGEGAGFAEAERAAWRAQAREWLRADLELWAHTVATSNAATRYEIRRRLGLLRDHACLAGLRDAEEISKLPVEEIQDCQSIWRDVDALQFRLDQQK